MIEGMLIIVLSAAVTGCSSQKQAYPESSSGLIMYNPRDAKVSLVLDSTLIEARDKGPLDIEPKLIQYELPEYPKIQRMAGIEGEVVIEVIIDRDGNVTDSKVVMSSVPPALEDIILAASEEFRYRPGLRDDKPIECRASHTILFVLKHEVN